MEVVVRSAASKAPKGSFFDFVVANRPIYIPRSEPVPEPTIMPIHDKDGIIQRKISSEAGQTQYIITFEDTPYLKMCVDERNILDYVSARTYERFHHEEYHEMLRKETEDPRTKAKNERLRQEENGEKPARGKPRKKRKKNSGTRPKALTTKRSSMGSPILPTRRKTSEIEEEPKLTFKSPQRPTHISPNSKQWGLAQTIYDSESEEEEEFREIENTQIEVDKQFGDDLFDDDKYDFDDTLATEAALDRQLQGFNNRPPQPKSEPSQLSQQHDIISISSKTSISPEPTPWPFRRPEPILSPRSKRETSSRPSTSSSSRSNTNSRAKRQRTFGSANASISSLEAGRTFEKLSQNAVASSSYSTPKKLQASSTHSHHASSQTRPKSIFASTPKPSPSPQGPITIISSSSSDSNSNVDDEEFEIDCILKDRWMADKNRNPIQEFLIKWEGYPEDEATWESEDNIPQEVIASYYAAKMLKSSSKRRLIVDIALTEDNALRKRDKGKGKAKAIPGDVGDEESLFLPGPGLGPSKKSPYFADFDLEEDEESRPSSRNSGLRKKRVSFSPKEDEIIN